jgi:hypothetical protein
MNFAYPRNKYHAKKVNILGIDFDSKKEGMRWLLLKDMEAHGEISNLQRQVPFELLPAIYEDVTVHLKTKDKIERRLKQRSVNYIADFTYTKDGKQIVEDTKGLRLPEYILKKKMMLALLNIEISEV